MNYSIAKNGERLGPFTREQVLNGLSSGNLSPEDLVWTTGMTQWKSLRELPEFSISAPPVPEISRRKDLRDELHDDYLAFIGPDKAHYYVPIFERFDATGSSTSWNLPAAFFTHYWMLYRGMYLWGLLLYPLCNTALFILIVGMCMAVIGPRGAAAAYTLAIPLSIIFWGLYANKIFHRHTAGQIEKSKSLRLTPQQRHDWLVRKGATGYIWILFLFVIPAIIGILAAIAIPAYQDYTIRTQAMEGIVLARQSQSSVEAFYLQHHQFPANNSEAGLPSATSITGKYVSQITTSDGEIDITFGGSANARLNGHTVKLVATPDTNDTSLEWHCETGDSNLPSRFLPQTCRRD